MWLVSLAYLYAVLPSIEKFLVFLALIPIAVSIVIPFLGAVVELLDDEGVLALWKKWVPKAAMLTVVAMGINVIVPDREGFKYIVGAYVAVEVGTSVSEIEGIERLPESMVNMIDAFMKSMTAEFEESALDVSSKVQEGVSTTGGETQ